ncbi:ImmA/IrrE family metallo-endopeptidase [Candidatus Palauibacter sp.]|uniref:ImmA/IrrE family metallo-endopeptidase n=1 Tax=Candidatus Palauibacter sp. TaxID=3101350 RepID=UPI003B01247D
MHTSKPNFSRRALATEAMRGAIATRAKAKLDQHSPICIYELCEKLRVTVRFNSINMEGMYQHGVPPRIHLSALRPLPRRAYNCAHELGHHIFGHGSSIDELSENAKQHPWEDSKEFVADAFAGFTLMPIVGLRRAFATRGWAPATATAAQMFTIACHFGVGYGTLLTHLSAGVNMISLSRTAALKRVTPKALRRDILGVSAPEPLIVADRHRVGPTLDAEVEMLLCLPPGTETTGNCLAYERDLTSGRLFRTVRPGIVQASTASGSWVTFVRIAPEAYVGLARYRHLEECPG